MGLYLKSKAAYVLYKSEFQKAYFVDKSMILSELFPLVRSGNNHICITRPRRFGKTVMANMISAFFSNACDTTDVFAQLKIAQDKNYLKYCNQYFVIHISFNDSTRQNTTYEQYINRIENRLLKDLKKEFPEMEFDNTGSAVDAFMDIYTENETARFIFILDEWDYVFHQEYVTEEDKKNYLFFLQSLLKDRPYVQFAYMTGILPIAKYSSGSELNMFAEYTMATEERFSEYFGFTQPEVDMLYERYLRTNIDYKVTKEGMKEWYNGYHTLSGVRVYNPRSVVYALENNNLGNYWTSSGPYDEIFYYIENNVDAVRDEVALIVSGIPVQTEIREYAATSQKLKTKEEILSAMVVYGFLSYEAGKVSVPNRELMKQFAGMLKREASLGYIYQLANESERMLKATLMGDTDTMVQILEFAHNTETPLLSYNNETELTAVVNLVYLSARDQYRIEREDKAGIGYVDFIFYPETDRSATGIILELKVDHSPEDAIMQIKERKYELRFSGKIGNKRMYTGKLLAVGIGYDKKTKKHACKVELLSGTGSSVSQSI